MAIDKERLEALTKIKNLESQGIFDIDVENDPPTLELYPDKVDYLHKKLKTKILSRLTLRGGKKFFEGQIKAGNLIIKDIKGIENLPSKKEGAIITCNHFHPFDNYIVLKAILPSLKHGRFWKVIREGNYTNPPKGFDMFFKYGDTLPLSSNLRTMALFMNAINTLLGRKDKILVYPEQAMWWNYRKPRPLKPGAYKFAAKNNVPVVPLFITMEDSNKIGADGLPIQEHTVFIGKPIYPDQNKTIDENVEAMSKANYEFMVATYESFYNTKLKYDIKKEK